MLTWRFHVGVSQSEVSIRESDVQEIQLLTGGRRPRALCQGGHVPLVRIRIDMVRRGWRGTVCEKLLLREEIRCLNANLQQQCHYNYNSLSLSTEWVYSDKYLVVFFKFRTDLERPGRRSFNILRVVCHFHCKLRIYLQIKQNVNLKISKHIFANTGIYTILIMKLKVTNSKHRLLLSLIIKLRTFFE